MNSQESTPLSAVYLQQTEASIYPTIPPPIVPERPWQRFMDQKRTCKM